MICGYDTVRWPILTCAQMLTSSQLNMPHGTKQKKNNKKTNKNRDAQKKRSSHKVRGVSPKAERESMVRKICERRRS